MARITARFISGHKILCTPSAFGGWDLESAGFKRPAKTFDSDMWDALTRIARVMPGDVITKEDMRYYKVAWALLENANNDDEWCENGNG